MLKVAVFFGGDSVESDISVITGIGALSSLDAAKYDGIAVYVRDNKFWVAADQKALSVGVYSKFNKSNFKEVYISNKRLVFANKRFKEKPDVKCNKGSCDLRARPHPAKLATS